MRILHINKFFWVAGGVERYMFDVADLFERNGHEVHYFSMQDESRNRDHPDSKYFVSNIDYKTTNYWQKLSRARQIIGKTIYSFESRRKLREMIADIKPDIAHLHLIDHHISPSILPELKAAGVPIVQTIHEYKRICPNYRLYIERTSETCTRCLSGNYMHCLGQKCLKDSYTASALVTTAMYLHRWSKVWDTHVDLSLCVTDFVKDMLKRGGVPESQLLTVPLMIRMEDYQPSEERGDYILFAGRLAPEKGLFTLLKAMENLPDIRLKIAGDGPVMDDLRKIVEEKSLHHVEFTGYIDGIELRKLMAQSRFLVFPSEWYEPGALTISESQAMERPVIGARIGGIPETMEDGISGLLFEPGNIEELTEKIQYLYSHKEESIAMGKASRKVVENRASGQYDMLLGIYEKLINH
jgi:glycosyltransferase involved in cell wall biosynthesis